MKKPKWSNKMNHLKQITMILLLSLVGLNVDGMKRGRDWNEETTSNKKPKTTSNLYSEQGMNLWSNIVSGAFTNHFDEFPLNDDQVEYKAPNEKPNPTAYSHSEMSYEFQPFEIPLPPLSIPLAKENYEDNIFDDISKSSTYTTTTTTITEKKVSSK